MLFIILSAHYHTHLGNFIIGSELCVPALIDLIIFNVWEPSRFSVTSLKMNTACVMDNL